MARRAFLIVAVVCVFSLFSSFVVAGVKDTYKGKLAPRNIQLNVQAAEGGAAQLTESEKREYASSDRLAPSVIASFAVYSTSYKASLEEDIADIKGEVNFEVFSKGQVKIPIVRKDNVGLIEVSVNRGTAFVIAEGNKYTLVVDRPGKYRLDLEYLIKIQREREGGPGQFIVETMPAPISEFEFTIAEPKTDVFIEPSIKVETKEEGGKTVAWAIMPMTNSILVRWTKALEKEVITHVKLEPKVYSTVYTFASVGEGLLHCNSIVNYSILQSEIPGVRISLPEDVSVLEVRTPDLRDWKVTKKEGQQILEVYFKYGVKGNYNLDFSYERNIGEGSVVAQVPLVKPLDVERSKGFIGIASISNVEVAVSKSERATAIDVKELPPFIWDRSASPILLAFKYLNDEYDIQLEVTKHEEIPVLIAAIDAANYVTLRTDEGKALTKVVYQVRNNVKQFLKLTLPEGASLWSSSVSGVPVKPAKDKEGHILIPLEKSQLRGEALTQIPVEVVYLEKGGRMGFAGGLKLDLPKTDIPTNELYWSIFLPKDYTYYAFGGDIKKMEQEVEILSRLAAPMVAVKKELASSYERQQVLEEKTLDKVSQKGALPIKIDVPQVGKAYRFSKLLVTENEGARLTASYIAIFRGGFGKIIKLVLLILVIFVVIVAARNLLRRR